VITPAKLQSWALLAVLGVGLGLAAWVAVRGARGAGQDAAKAIGRAALNAAGGAVVGVGELVGLPDPATVASRGKCCAAMAAGENFRASLYCSASEFLAWQINGAKPKACK